MIIEIDKEYENEIIGNNSLSDDELAFFEARLLDMFEGRILLRASLNFYSFLLSEPIVKSFSKTQRGVLLKICDSYTTIMSDARLVKSLIMVSDISNSSVIPTVFSIKDFPHNIVPYFYCENIEDCKSFLILFQNLKTTKDVFIKSASFCGCNYSVIDDAFDNKDIFFCVVDSDKKFPGAPLGGTATMIQGSYDNHLLHPLNDLYILNVQEKENLVPVDFFYCLDSNKQKIITAVSGLNDDVKNYFDIKSGLMKQDFRSMDHSSPRYTICLNVVNQLASLGYTKSSKREVAEFGSDIIEKSIKHSTIQYSCFWSKTTPLQKQDLENIFDLILKYGYCEKITIS